MNYIKELRAFKDWLLLNDLNTSAIALWHTLMAINNMTGWKERFNAPNSTVEKLTGLSKQGLVNARKKLIENGLIEYEKGKKGKAPIYKIVSLVNSVDQSVYQSEYQSVYQSHDQSVYKRCNIPKHKLNNIDDEDNNARVNPFTFFESEGFGTISGFISEKIGALIDDYGERKVLAAMQEAVTYGARNLKYVQSILTNPKRGEKSDSKVYQHGRSSGRPATKTAEQAMREAEEARRAWGG